MKCTRLLLLLFWGISLVSCAKRPATKPNIILILADDLGYETLGTYGGESYSTPNLDRLADEGMKFNYCYSMPLCTPTRVQIMTGKYNFRNYIGFGLLDPAEKTFADYLADEGYIPAVVGKWQLYGNERQRELAGGREGSWPEEAGFSKYLLWQVHERGSRYKDPTLTETGRVTKSYPGKYGPDLFLEFAEEFIEQHKDSTFFLYYPMALTHDPFVPTPLQVNFEDSMEQGKNQPRYFGDMLYYMDSIVGRIVRKLENEGIRENTLLMFVGDNGTDRKVRSVFDGREIKGNKGYTDDAGNHVPFIVSWPGKVKAGVENNELIDLTDFLPTLLEASGSELPDSTIIDGLSFYGQLTGKKGKTRDWVFTHYDPVWGNFKSARFVQNREWKVYGNGNIFNIESDIDENDTLTIQNLSAEDAATIKGLISVLERMR